MGVKAPTTANWHARYGAPIDASWKHARGDTCPSLHERAHVGTRGNEVADALAKRGTECGKEDGVCEREPTPKTSSVVRAGHAADSARPPGDPG